MKQDTKLSKNFTLEEFLISQTATRLGIDNTPNAVVRSNLNALVNSLLQPLRDKLGKPIVVSSGYRSSALNAAIHGSKSSQHCFGEAVDFTVIGMPVLDVCKFILDSGLEFDQLIYEGNWVHLSYSKTKNRRNVLEAVFSSKGVSYKQGLPEN